MSDHPRELRAYPHKPKPALLAEALGHAREDYQAGQTKAAAAAAEGRAIFFKIQGERALEVAALEYAFGGAAAEVRGWLASAREAARTATALGRSARRSIPASTCGISRWPC